MNFEPSNGTNTWDYLDVLFGTCRSPILGIRIWPDSTISVLGVISGWKIVFVELFPAAASCAILEVKFFGLRTVSRTSGSSHNHLLISDLMSIDLRIKNQEFWAIRGNRCMGFWTDPFWILFQNSNVSGFGQIHRIIGLRRDVRYTDR